jgi:hypothetical protein
MAFCGPLTGTTHYHQWSQWGQCNPNGSQRKQARVKCTEKKINRQYKIYETKIKIKQENKVKVKIN